MQSNRPYDIHSMAQAEKSGKQVALAFVVRFGTKAGRNAFYAASGNEGQGAEKRAHAMLRELGLAGGGEETETADVLWVLPRAKAGRARPAVQPGTACSAGVKAEAQQGTGPGTGAKGWQSNGSSSRHDAMTFNPSPGEPAAAKRQHLAARNGLAGGSEALALCLRLHAVVCSSRSKEAAEWQARLRAEWGASPPPWFSAPP